MKWLAVIIVYALFAQLQAQSFVQKSNELVEMFQRDAFDSVYATFNAELKAKITPIQLRSIWKQLQLQAGSFIQAETPQVSSANSHTTVITTLEMEKHFFKLQLTFEDTSKQVAGIFFLPGKEKEISWKTPGYVSIDLFEEVEVTFGEAPFIMKGTLTLPKNVESPPVVVLVHGSGPNDRNQTIGPNKIFKELAWGLASKGIAVLRYDKRSFLYASKINPQQFTLEEETIQDAVEACALLKNRKDIDTHQIYVAGHSLGGMCAPLIGKRAHSAGIIILAGNARKLYDLLPEQFEYVLGLDGLTQEDEQQLENIKEQVQRVRKGKFSHDTPDELMPLQLSAPYWDYVRKYDALHTASQYNGRILVVQGKRDYQVTMTDFEGWKKGLKRKAEFQLFDNLNHLFQSGVGKSYPMEYQQVNPVSEELISTLVQWIKKSK